MPAGEWTGMTDVASTNGPETGGVLRALADAWRRYGRMIFAIGVTISVSAALLRVGHGVYRLVSPADRRGGIDLRLRFFEVEAWFAGEQVYGRLGSAVYPPASYTMFWPFVGWNDRLTARWIWAVTTLAMLAWLAWLLWREHGSRPRIERAWLALLPFAGYATHSTLATGQVSIHVVTLLVAGLLVLVNRSGLRADITGSAVILPALIKPTLSVPLFWIAFLVPGRIRPAALIIAGYAVLTLFAASFQPVGLIQLLRGWLAGDSEVQLDATHTNLQRLLAGADHLFLPLALLIITATGVWVFRHRRVDLWILMGVTALVARMLTYHRGFDDFIIILPTVALYRIAVSTASLNRRVIAGTLALACFGGMMAPRLLITDIEAAVLLLNNVLLPLTWGATLGFLLFEAHRLRAESAATPLPRPLTPAPSPGI